MINQLFKQMSKTLLVWEGWISYKIIKVCMSINTFLKKFFSIHDTPIGLYAVSLLFLRCASIKSSSMYRWKWARVWLGFLPTADSQSGLKILPCNSRHILLYYLPMRWTVSGASQLDSHLVTNTTQ